MTTHVDFLYDFGSPNAFLSHCAIPKIEARADIRFDYVPVLLGGIFKETGNVSPAVSLQGIRNKGEYTRIETQRWLTRFDVEMYPPNPHFPVNTLMMMRGAVFARDKDFYPAYIDAMYTCMWRESRKMDELEIFAGALKEFDLPADDILTGIQDPAVKQGLITNTSAAVERGAFGSPTFFVGDEIWFGKETLRDIEEGAAA